MKRLAIVIALTAQSVAAQMPEQRAVDYLARETPRWFRENSCFSCHNNGDAARALYTASRKGYKVPQEALADTTEWLLRPLDWDNNHGDPGFSDKKLARIQFAAALVEAYNAGVVRDRDALTKAAESLLPYQAADGSWQVDVASVGSPATYGTALATYMAVRTLNAAGGDRVKEAQSKALAWFRKNTPRSTLEQSVSLLTIPTPQVTSLLLRAQSSDGGWGPYPGSPAEPFDTAVALMALQNLKAPNRTAIDRGRAFLIARQERSGGWPETTRPPGAQSYAEHISTSGWATLALILTAN